MKRYKEELVTKKIKSKIKLSKRTGFLNKTKFIIFTKIELLTTI